MWVYIHKGKSDSQSFVHHFLTEKRCTLITRNILVNKVRCDKCGDEIESTHVHDFKQCSCENIFVDGGKEYLRRGGTLEHYTELSEYEEFTTIEYEVEVPIVVKVRAKTDDEKVLDKLAKQVQDERFSQICGTSHHISFLREQFPDVEIAEAITFIDPGV